MGHIMMVKQKQGWLWVGLLCVVCSVMACGPIQSSTQIGDAMEAIKAAEAKDVEAWKWACFDYYAATLYLKKAREEAGFADFEAAATLAAKAARHAKEATKLARIRQAQGYRLPTCDSPWAMAQQARHQAFFRKGVLLRDKDSWSSRIEEIHKK